MVFERLADHAVGSFDLAVALGVGDRGVVDIASVISAKVPEDRAGEKFAQVGDYPIGHTKTMCDVSDELCVFFRC
jgi:hypothetical protein